MALTKTLRSPRSSDLFKFINPSSYLHHKFKEWLTSLRSQYQIQTFYLQPIDHYKPDLAVSSISITHTHTHTHSPFPSLSLTHTHTHTHIVSFFLPEALFPKLPLRVFTSAPFVYIGRCQSPPTGSCLNQSAASDVMNEREIRPRTNGHI